MRRHENGAATSELAIVIPVLLVLLTFAIPLVRAGWEYHVLTRATSHGVRYATRVEPNARESSAGLTRRPTAEEVQTSVRAAAGPLDPDAVAVTVDPEPVNALPGERITVTASYELSFGPGAVIANRLRNVLWGGDIFPESTTVTVSAWGREE